MDSGFIVLNDRTYPLLRRLFAELGVDTRPTEMSMSITCDECGLNYVGGRKAPGIFAQRRRLARPAVLAAAARDPPLPEGGAARCSPTSRTAA